MRSRIPGSLYMHPSTLLHVCAYVCACIVCVCVFVCVVRACKRACVRERACDADADIRELATH